MRPLPNRAEKLALLLKIVEGRLTTQDAVDLRRSRQPMYITLNLGDDVRLPPNDPEVVYFFLINLLRVGRLTPVTRWMPRKEVRSKNSFSTCS